MTFTKNPPVAIANSSYNRSEYFTQTRTAYSLGMGDFCGTCHPDMHTSAGILRHPTNQRMSGTTQSNYNFYVKSGGMTGIPTTSYWSLVPFEEGLPYSTANINTLASHAKTDDSNLNGPGSSSGFLQPHESHYNNSDTFSALDSPYRTERRCVCFS